jgi:hypothetical protein
MISRCKKVVIELSLYDKKKKQYIVVQSESQLTEDQIQESIIDPRSFIFYRGTIPFESKKLLSVVYNKVLKAVIKSVSVEDYNIPLSHVYFCFQAENDEIVFSSPHITSPIIFNPNDTHGTYTLDQYRRAQATKLSKRLESKVAVYEYNSSDQPNDYTAKGRAEVKHKIDCHDITNSLFDYFTVNDAIRPRGSNSSGIQSIYADKPELFGLAVISSFELRDFRYITDNQ